MLETPDQMEHRATPVFKEIPETLDSREVPVSLAVQALKGLWVFQVCKAREAPTVNRVALVLGVILGRSDRLDSRVSVVSLVLLGLKDLLVDLDSRVPQASQDLRVQWVKLVIRDLREIQVCFAISLFLYYARLYTFD